MVRLAGFFFVAFTSVLAAQSPSDRLGLERYRDSLSATHDTTALRKASAGRPRDPLAQLRLGLVALRLAELGADSGGREAIKRLRRVTERRPDWPLAWHALGLAEARHADSQQADRLALGSRVGLGALERATERHLRALDADPAYAPAALALAALTLGLRDTTRFSVARDAVRRAVAASRPAPPDLLLAWGRVERAAGDPDSSAAAFERYIAAGGNRALGLLERARTGLAAGEEEAESLYYDGATWDDSIALAGYRDDLAPVAADSQLALLDRLRGEDRASFLRRFWSDRDRYDMRPDGERIREHYRRLLHARRTFPLTVSRRFYGAADAYRSGSDELDDRGVIYVRHGDPAERLRPFVFGLMPNESWHYRRAEGDLVFHFSAGYDENGGGDLYDYRLVESVLDLRGAADSHVDQLILSRRTLSPVYSRMLNWGRLGAGRAYARERGMGQASIAIGTSTDSYELQFARPLTAFADLIAVGFRPGGSLAHLVFATSEPGPTRVRLVALPTDDRPPVAIDTVVDLPGRRPLREGEYVVGRVEVGLDAGTWGWRVALSRSDSVGVVLAGDSVRVASSAGLALSDLALGAPETGARWTPVPSDTVLFTPAHMFPAGGEVGLYYEAREAAAVAPYRHEIAVYRMKGKPARPERRPVVSLAFEEPAGGSTLRSHRTLQLRRLEPGSYVVEVRVTGPAGASSSRQREFRLVEKP